MESTNTPNKLLPQILFIGLPSTGDTSDYSQAMQLLMWASLQKQKNHFDTCVSLQLTTVIIGSEPMTKNVFKKM